MAGNQSKEILSEEKLQLLKKTLSEVKYGTVTLVIQDGVLVQIEKNEKFRLRWG